jgi:hypothetical protein
MCRPGTFVGWRIMRWRVALAVAASVAGAALLSGAGPAWADQPTAAVVRRADAAALSVLERAITPPGDERLGPLEVGRPEVPPVEVRVGEAPPPPDGRQTEASAARQPIANTAGNAVAVGMLARVAAGGPVTPPRDSVLPTGTAVVPSAGPSVPGTGGGDGDSDPRATGMAVGSVLLIGVGLIAAGVALVGLRNRRDTADHSH